MEPIRSIDPIARRAAPVAPVTLAPIRDGEHRDPQQRRRRQSERSRGAGDDSPGRVDVRV
jgi:hypothetical protein